MVKVSVIVPVYNVYDYLSRCLDSLVKQTLKDIEIIVVNDGSPDNSQEIIDEYVSKYKNVKSFIKKNGGLSDARNYGIKRASGEYIAFVDSDDYVDKNMLKKLYSKANKGNFDIVVCDLDMVYNDGSFIQNVSSNLDSDIEKSDIKNYMIRMYPSAWNKLYKKSLFDNNIYFKKGIWFEDVEFIYRLIPYINSIGCVKDVLYHYVQREGAITKTFDNRIYDYIDNWNGIIKYYKDNNLYGEYREELEYCYVRYLYATFIKQATNYKDKNEFDNAVKCAIKNVKKMFPKYRGNKYFYKSFKGIYMVFFNKIIANILYIKNRNRR